MGKILISMGKYLIGEYINKTINLFSHCMSTTLCYRPILAILV